MYFISQVEWFVKDGDKSEAGDVMYRAYATNKKARPLFFFCFITFEPRVE